MILSDWSIKTLVGNGSLVIRPFNIHHLQPSSYDISLGGNENLVLEPMVFVLATSLEHIEIPSDIQAQVHGRSSVGRLGVLVHFTAGLIDPGFRGQITLECMALHKRQVFQPGDRIGQLTFHKLDAGAVRPYSGRYQDQVGVVESRFEHDYKLPRL